MLPEGRSYAGKLVAVDIGINTEQAEKHRIRCMRLMLEIIESFFLQDRKILTKEALGSCW